MSTDKENLGFIDQEMPSQRKQYTSPEIFEYGRLQDLVKGDVGKADDGFGGCFPT